MTAKRTTCGWCLGARKRTPALREGGAGALRVISRSSVMQYRKNKKPLQEIARELNWAQSYDREARDVLALQAEVARAIAQAVQVEVRPADNRRLSRAAVNVDAYEAYRS